jgi:hypothetical protein
MDVSEGYSYFSKDDARHIPKMSAPELIDQLLMSHMGHHAHVADRIEKVFVVTYPYAMKMGTIIGRIPLSLDPCHRVYAAGHIKYFKSEENNPGRSIDESIVIAPVFVPVCIKTIYDFKEFTHFLEMNI